MAFVEITLYYTKLFTMMHLTPIPLQNTDKPVNITIGNKSEKNSDKKKYCFYLF